MKGRFQINADRVLDANEIIEKGTNKIDDAKDILSGIDIPDDFCYEDKLINYIGTMSSLVDRLKDFTGWLKHQVEAYKGIKSPVVTTQHSKIVTKFEERYLRETLSGVEYYSPKSVEEVKLDWENLPAPIKILSRFFDNFELAIASFITMPPRLIFFLGSALPGKLGEESARQLKELDMAEYKELITDMSGSNYMSEGIVRDIVDASGNIIGKVTIYFTIVGGVGELAEIGMIAHYETVKDGVVIAYEFAQNLGDVSTYAYSNGDIDISDETVRRQIFDNAIESSIVNTSISMYFNDLIDETFAKNIVITTADKIKDLLLRGALGAVDQSIEALTTNVYKATMTQQEFLELIKSISPAEIVLYSFVYSPITNTINIYKDSKPCAQIEITNGGGNK